MKRPILVALASLVVALSGCASELPPEPEVAPPFPEGTGQASHAEVAYPAGPYGYKPGAILENYQFQGFQDASLQNDVAEPVQLADFYNPTGAELFPEGSPYAGTPKPKAMVVTLSAVWCGPCNYEAQEITPVEHAKYKPMGGEFLLQLTDGPVPGTPAEEKHLRNWTTKYDVDFPSTIDPGYRLMNLSATDAFPQNYIVDTSTMELVKVVAGVPDASFWSAFEALLE